MSVLLMRPRSVGSALFDKAHAAKNNHLGHLTTRVTWSKRQGPDLLRQAAAIIRPCGCPFMPVCQPNGLLSNYSHGLSEHGVEYNLNMGHHLWTRGAATDLAGKHFPPRCEPCPFMRNWSAENADVGQCTHKGNAGRGGEGVWERDAERQEGRQSGVAWKAARRQPVTSAQRHLHNTAATAGVK